MTIYVRTELKHLVSVVNERQKTLLEGDVYSILIVKLSDTKRSISDLKLSTQIQINNCFLSDLGRSASVSRLIASTQTT